MFRRNRESITPLIKEVLEAMATLDVPQTTNLTGCITELSESASSKKPPGAMPYC
jgi:hypothetical protein